LGRPFGDPAVKPIESALESTFGPAFDRYQAILHLAAAFSQEWNFSKAGGWMLKIHDGKKALLYLIPLCGSFKVSMAIREVEREALLADSDLAVLHDKLVSAKKYSEGFALQFDIDDAIDFAPVESLVSKLIAARR
jgi:Protein of unknown function (DUF3788)